MLRSFLKLFILLLILPGCATLLDRKQVIPIACSTPQCEVRIRSQHIREMGPLFVEVDREKVLEVETSANGQMQIQKIEGELRVAESITPNLLLALVGGGALAIAGLLVDYYTESMYDIPNPRVAQFKAKDQKLVVEKIVILPPTSSDPFTSDEAVGPILQDLKKKFPQAKIEVPEMHSKIFAKYGFTNESQGLSIEKQNNLFSDLGSTFVVYSEVNSSSSLKDSVVRYEVYDVLRRKASLEGELSYRSQLDSGSGKSWMLTKAAKLLPTGFGVNATQVSIYGSADTDNKEQPEFSSADYAAGRMQTLYKYAQVSGSTDSVSSNQQVSLSLNNFDTSVGETSGFQVKWSTDYSFTYAKFFLIENDVRFGMLGTEILQTTLAGADLYSLSALIGPEIGFNGFAGYLFLNVMTGAEFANVQTSNNKSLYEVQVPLKLSVGWRIKASENWLIGLTSSLYSQSAEFMQRIADETVGKDQIKLYGATLYSVNLGLTYHFPESRKIGRSYLRNLAKK